MKSLSTFGLAIVVVGVFFFLTQNLLNQLEQQREVRSNFVTLVSEIKHLDEILTMSARMAAAGGGQEYVDRYNKHVSMLDDALAAANKFLVQHAQATHVADTQAANGVLVELETKALAMVEKGQLKDAWMLLHSGQYQENKSKYWVGMQKAFSITQAEVESIYANTEWITALTIAVGLIAFVLVCGYSVHQARRTYLEKKTLTNELLASKAELIEKSDALTKNNLELKNAIVDLERAKGRAESATRSKSNILSSMSHEIRTPMNGVIGMAELLSETPLNSKQRMFADAILKSGSSLLSVINDVLDYSKLDTDQLILDRLPFELRSVVDDVAILASGRTADKEIELITRLDPDLPEAIVGDAARIRQILTNLVNNAVKNTTSGHIYLNVEAKKAEKTGPQFLGVRFSVEDTGSGISPDQLDEVQAMFTDGVNGPDVKNGGKGLGLSICASLISLMEGKCGIENEHGKGAKFWFEIDLPIHHDCLDVPELTADVSGARILVVDDNAINRAILTEQLKSWKFDCAAVESGEEALSVMKAVLSQSLTVDCVLLDYQMPGMNGAEVVSAMKADPTTSDIPVILLTSMQETTEGAHLSEIGATRQLIRPTPSALLLETIVQVLSTNRCFDAQGRRDRNTVFGAKKVDVDTPVELDNQTAAAELQDVMPADADDEMNVDVLICEDNEVNQVVFEQILKMQGCSYKIACNGREAVAMYREYKPSLLLMDVSMPKMNGLDATRNIREIELETGVHVPIVGVTAHTANEDAERCFDAGMDDYLTKPVSPYKLATVLNKWLPEFKFADQDQI